MLGTLSIRDIVLIETLELDFSGGMTVLTGETGAGKSILLDSLSLALGARGDGSLVRKGAEQGSVTAVFDPPMSHPARALMAEQGLPNDEAVILRRVQTRDGRSRAFVNDVAVGVAFLRDLGALLVEIHGQHDDRALVDPNAHRALLDAYGGHETLLSAVSRAHANLKAAGEARETAAARLEQAEQEREFLTHAVGELRDLRPEAGEDEALAARRHAMMQAESVADDLSQALEAVAGQNDPAVPIAGILRRLERRPGAEGPVLKPILAALEQVLTELGSARETIERALADGAFDQGEMDRIEERLFALRALARKHQVQVDDLAALMERMERDLAAIDAGAERLAACEAALVEAKTSYDKAAAVLSAARREAAGALDEAVMAELAPLKLGQARFATDVDSDPARPSSAHGNDRVSFTVQTNPGADPGPIGKIASGGELSRFILALKVALADRGSAPTLVFDEIDTAVGGAVADAIGQRLKRLSGNVQVLSVTHAPQVAAIADHHYRIEKTTGEVMAATNVTALDSATRGEEIARMLAGATITDEARAAARRLMGSAS
ncbi:MAG: DNA repair protein RecN [Rhodobiaceae bacterium]|nr:DNA repair protein RecN [Rhodobiaceae bacterium]